MKWINNLIVNEVKINKKGTYLKYVPFFIIIISIIFYYFLNTPRIVNAKARG